jgi:hypothetical protein
MPAAGSMSGIRQTPIMDQDGARSHIPGQEVAQMNHTMRRIFPGRSLAGFAVLSVIALATTALPAAPAHAEANCMALNGTIAGHYEFGGPDGDAWYGWAFLRFGNDLTVYAARLVDQNDGYKGHPSHVKPDGSGNFAGYEILTFTVEGLGSFQMTGHFIAMAGTTPYFSGFSEEGKLVPEAGTGQFAGMTGNVSSHGSAIAGPWSPTQDNPWIWISQMTGSVCKP